MIFKTLEELGAKIGDIVIYGYASEYEVGPDKTLIFPDGKVLKYDGWDKYRCFTLKEKSMSVEGTKKMTFDPTTNRVQWHLLTDEEKAALKAWPHGWEYYFGGTWADTAEPRWYEESIYRGEPAPVVEKRWSNVYRSSGDYVSRTAADVRCPPTAERIAVLRIEIVDGVATAYLEDV